MAAAGGNHVAWQLLDVLEHLPVPLLRESFWPLLRARGHVSSCRVTCHRMLRLSEQLQRSFSLQLGRVTDPSEEQYQCLGRCLGRHEHIEVLDIWVSQDEERTAKGLLTGAAACKRVHKLQVSPEEGLSAIMGEAIALACPALHILQMEYGFAMELDFFGALESLEYLHEVRINSFGKWPGITAALAPLKALRSLHLFVEGDPPLAPGDMLTLTALTGLKELWLTTSIGQATELILQGTALASLTQLTHLRLAADTTLSNVQHGCSATDPACADAHNLVLAQLGVTLKSLVRLRLSGTAIVDDTGFSGLRRFCHLTCLHLDGLCLSPAAASSGNLPLLAKLCLTWSVSPAELLDTLRPLQPLRSLAKIKVQLCLGSSMSAEASAAAIAAAGGDEASAAADALLALRSGVAYLAAAPCLEHVVLNIVGSSASTNTTELTEYLAVLQVLQPRLARINLRHCSAAQLQELSTALARCAPVTTLQLDNCALNEAIMLDVATHAHTLRKLLVFGFECSVPAHVPNAFLEARQDPVRMAWQGFNEADHPEAWSRFSTPGGRHGVSVTEADVHSQLFM